MKKLFETATKAIQDRQSWEEKQRVYYNMRHEGLRRQFKPFPRAADMHFPLVDMQIRKFKPFWYAQVFGAERLVEMVAERSELAPFASAASEFIDYQLNQQSNFEDEMHTVIDTMLLRGRAVIKAVVDPFDGHKLRFQAIDPMFLLVPAGTDCLHGEESDWFAEIKTLTVGQYKRNRRYAQGEEVIQRIRGRSRDDDQHWQEKHTREGLTHSTDADTIIVYEHWERTMGGWTVYTYSPQDPEVEIRKPFGCPYKWRGRASLPYFSFTMELKDKGWYSPRGVAELAAPFEAHLCKVWNEKLDAMTYGNRPLFTAEGQIPNTANIRFEPGEILPGNIKPVVMPQPALSFNDELNFARATSEQHLLMPDFGVMQEGQKGGQPRTATENQRIASLTNVGVEMNGRLFRRQLAKLYTHCWGMILQFRGRELTYFTANESKVMPEQALSDAYSVQPDGSADQWNRQERFNRAAQRYQLLGADPNANHEVLVEELLASDDPRLARRAFVPTGVMEGEEREDEAKEILLLERGRTVALKPAENHFARLQEIMAYIQQQAALTQAGQPVNPIAMQRVMEHMAQHMELLRQQNPAAAKQIEQLFAAPQAVGLTDSVTPIDGVSASA